MENLSKLLKKENSELARLLRFSLYGVEATLKKALTELPNDPEALLCSNALLELNSLLQPVKNVVNVTPNRTQSPTADSNLADVLHMTSPPMQTGELKLNSLQKEFNSDKQLASYLGNNPLQSQTDSDLWNEVQRKLLRVPEDLAKSWQERALIFAQEVGALANVSNCHQLPLNRNENIYPGLRGTIQTQGLCFSKQAPLHPQIAQLNLKNYQGDFQENLYFLAGLVSACIELINLEPDLHHALKSIFSFDTVNLHSKPEQRSQYIDALIDSFWRTLKAESNGDLLSALRYWIDLDEAVHSLVFLPPVDRFSWWGKLQQQVRSILKKVVERTQSQGYNIKVRPLSGLYADVCAFSKDDLRLDCGGNPGEVLACLRVYAKINEQEFPGRVLFRSSQ